MTRLHNSVENRMLTQRTLDGIFHDRAMVPQAQFPVKHHICIIDLSFAIGTLLSLKHNSYKLSSPYCNVLFTGYICESNLSWP